MVTRAIARAQKRVEEQNFGSRKHLLEYDDVMNQQRQVVYKLRSEALHASKRLEFVEEAAHAIAVGALGEISPERTGAHAWDLDQVAKAAKSALHAPVALDGVNPAETHIDDLAGRITEQAMAGYKTKTDKIGDENARRLESWVFLQVIDRAWKNHLLAMDSLKDSVSLRGYGQRDPLQEYKKEGYRLFEEMMARIHEESASALISIEIPDQPPDQTARDLQAHEEEEEDDGRLQMSHPSPAAATPAGRAAAPQRSQTVVPPARRGPDESKLIYHGTRQQQPRPESQAKAAAQTFKRDVEKVGRNDPCPGGSGMKYKKCHGATAGSEDSAV
jgi:preprotein translocase subunit SecA